MTRHARSEQAVAGTARRSLSVGRAIARSVHWCRAARPRRRPRVPHNEKNSLQPRTSAGAGRNYGSQLEETRWHFTTLSSNRRLPEWLGPIRGRGEVNRSKTIDLILDESQRQRRDQDERLEYARRTAAVFLGIWLPATALALSRLQGDLPLARTIVAGVLLSIGLWAAYGVLRPLGWQAGPSIDALIDGPYRSGADEHEFRWVLVRSHQATFAANELQVRRAQRRLVLSIAMLTFGAVTLWSAFAG